MNMRDATLKAVYAEELAKARDRYQADYVWPASDLPLVVQRMNAAIDRMSFNKDSPAWKATCKRLGIAHTYKAIRAYLAGDSNA